MSTDNIKDLLQIAEAETKIQQLDFSKNNEYLIKYLRNLLIEFNIQVGITPGTSKIRPVYLFDYLMNWAKPFNLLKNIKPRIDKRTLTWLGRELKNVYNIEYGEDTKSRTRYFLLEISHFKNFDLTEYNPDSFLMMRKYKLKYDKQKKKTSQKNDENLKKEKQEKKTSNSQKLLRPKKRTKSS